MRDIETISTAITAAETGHLLLSSLHTLGAAKTIDRVIDAFPANQQNQIRAQLSMDTELARLLRDNRIDREQALLYAIHPETVERQVRFMKD
jgi:Tfp pilus assembly pilus retraction ATPase PilT